MVYNGIIGANCISKFFLEKLLENIKEDAVDDIQLNLFLDTLEQLPDCSDIEQPLEVGKIVDKKGNVSDISKKPKKERKLSQYQMFMSRCAKKENGKGFSLCVVEWNKLKEINAQR